MKSMSLFYKIFFTFISILILGIGFVSYYAFKQAKDSYTASAYDHNSQRTSELKTRIIKEIEPISKNILFLTNSYSLQRYYIWKGMNESKKEKKYKQIFSDSLLDFLRTQKNYFKFRVIALNAKEILTAKYTYKDEKSFLVPEYLLQNKHNRLYFEKAKKLKKGEIYISQMNLNMENGEVEKPYVPVLRYSTPIVDDNHQTKAIFVATLYAQNILNILKNMLQRDKKSKIHYYLLDKDGDYLFHEDSSYMWNKQLKNGHNFFKENFNVKDILDTRNSMVFQRDDKIYSIEKVLPSQKYSKDFWYIISSQETSIAFSELSNFKLVYFVVLLLVTMIGIFVVRYVAKIITEPIEQVSNKLKALSLGDMRERDFISYQHDALGNAMTDLIKYIKNIQKQSEAITRGDLDFKVEVKSEFDYLSMSLKKMNHILKKSKTKNENDIWFSVGVGAFSASLVDSRDLKVLADEAISKICTYIGATSGVIYKKNDKTNFLNILGKYAANNYVNDVSFGDGLVGQVAKDKKAIRLSNINEHNYIIQTSGFSIKASEVYVAPILYENNLFGVVEIASMESFNELSISYVDRVLEILSSVFHNTMQRVKIKELLEESKRAFEELQVQSEELQESNVQMEEQQQQLTIQAKEMKTKNEELTRVKDELDIRAAELERSSKYKSEFLANMSHELRTPLNSIILLSKLLSQNSNTLNEEDKTRSSVINKAGNDLLLLINDILDLSKVESGNMELYPVATSSVEIFEELNGLFSEVANDKGIGFHLNDEFGGSFIVDKVKLLQVIKNLLSNAFKFTKSGSVHVDLTLESKNLVFKVSDTGLGIAKDKLEFIFEAFKQVDGSISRNYGGTGLGLSISKTFMDLLHGEISVQSVEGEGSVFTLCIPFNKSLEVPHKTINSNVIEDKIQEEDVFEVNLLKEKNILIVDDDSRNIFTLSSILQELGAETFSAMDGLGAIFLLEEERIDLILMDLMMPVMDGLEAISKIKSDERYKDIPIIVITAKTMQEDKDACYKAGADDYISKPINHNALVSMVKAWCR